MLTNAEIDRFHKEGYLVIENLVDEATLGAVRKEYGELMDRLYAGWHAEGLIKTPPDGLSFWEKLDQCYRGGFDWYQPMDISLPHSDIGDDTPMHIGPAVFDMVTHQKIVDTVECLIGPEITSNPIQHVRIKPPARALPRSEVRAHVTTTDWHQDMGVTLEEADDTPFRHGLAGDHRCHGGEWLSPGGAGRARRDAAPLQQDASRHCRCLPPQGRGGSGSGQGRGGGPLSPAYTPRLARQ